MYDSHNFESFKHWDELLKKVLVSETLTGENISSQLVINANDAVKMIFDSANDSHLSVVSPFLLLSCMQKNKISWGG